MNNARTHMSGALFSHILWQQPRRRRRRQLCLQKNAALLLAVSTVLPLSLKTLSSSSRRAIAERVRCAIIRLTCCIPHVYLFWRRSALGSRRNATTPPHALRCHGKTAPLRSQSTTSVAFGLCSVACVLCKICIRVVCCVTVRECVLRLRLFCCLHNTFCGWYLLWSLCECLRVSVGCCLLSERRMCVEHTHLRERALAKVHRSE